MSTSPVETLFGLLLVFVLPGFGLTRAIFPERRVFRPLSLRTLVEELTTTLILSIVVTVLVGFLWLGSSVGVQATWSDPLVEETLVIVAVAALAVAAARGSFSRIPPAAPHLEPEPGHEGPLDLVRELDRNARDERRLTHRLREAGERSKEGEEIRAELDRLRAETEALRRRREAEYAP